MVQKSHLFSVTRHQTMDSYTAETTLGSDSFTVHVTALPSVAPKTALPPVALCMHGHGSACTSVLWARFFPELSRAGFHVLSFDSPGFGRSSGATNQTIKWKRDDAQLVMRILECFGVGKDSARVAVLGQVSPSSIRFHDSDLTRPGKPPTSAWVAPCSCALCSC